jgi:hypothetical protein
LETVNKVTTADLAAKRADTKNLLLCLVIVAMAMLLVWPFGEIAYADDFAYSHVALRLVQTGHFLYNGWEFAMLLSHAWWGALFIRLFGFSFTCLRLSTIPFALGAVGTCYLLVRRAGLNPSSAFLITLTLGVSPLFVPLSITYMTDIPCLFFVLASLYSLSWAGELGSGPGSYIWLLLGAALGFVGGTGRQVVWLVPVVVLPYLAWVRRENRWFRISAEAAWVAVLAGVNYTTSWFRHQPYTDFQSSVFNEAMLAFKHPKATVAITARLALMLVLVTLPAIVPLLYRSIVDTWRGPRGRKILVAVLLLTVLAAIAIHPSLASLPWVSSTLNWQGINGDAPLPGRPIVLIRPIRALVAVTVYFTVCILAGELWNIRGLARRAGTFLSNPPVAKLALATMSLFAGVYFVLLVIRAAEIDIFDRYLLPIIPCATAILLTWFEVDNQESERMKRRVMPVAWTVLAVLASYAVLSTQDFWSLARARVTATRRLEAAGVARRAIDAGMEYDGWSQLLLTGQINTRWMTNPPGAYRPGLGITPDVKPVYILEYRPTSDSMPTEFGTVPYFSLLPPFRKQVSIDRIVAR